MSDEYKKCSKEYGFCETLSARVREAGSNSKGFVAMQTLNLSSKVGSPQIKTIGVMYKTSKSDRGLMLNECPWCGEKIDWFRDKE